MGADESRPVQRTAQRAPAAQHVPANSSKSNDAKRNGPPAPAPADEKKQKQKKDPFALVPYRVPPVAPALAAEVAALRAELLSLPPLAATFQIVAEGECHNIPPPVISTSACVLWIGNRLPYKPSRDEIKSPLLTEATALAASTDVLGTVYFQPALTFSQAIAMANYAGKQTPDTPPPHPLPPLPNASGSAAIAGAANTTAAPLSAPVASPAVSTTTTAAAVAKGTGDAAPTAAATAAAAPPVPVAYGWGLPAQPSSRSGDHLQLWCTRDIRFGVAERGVLDDYYEMMTHFAQTGEPLIDDAIPVGGVNHPYGEPFARSFAVAKVHAMITAEPAIASKLNGFGLDGTLHFEAPFADEQLWAKWKRALQSVKSIVQRNEIELKRLSEPSAAAGTDAKSSIATIASAVTPSAPAATVPPPAVTAVAGTVDVAPTPAPAPGAVAAASDA